MYELPNGGNVPLEARGPRTGHRASEMLIRPETAFTPIIPTLAILATPFSIPAAVTPAPYSLW